MISRCLRALLPAAVIWLATLAAPAAAATDVPTIELERVTGGLTFVISGTTADASSPVTVQRRSGSSWGRVTTAASVDHAFRATVTPTETTEYRVAVGGSASSSVTAEVLSDACGPRPHETATASWSCTLVDEFDGSELDRDVWVPQVYFESGTPAAFACYRDSPNNVSVSGGSLHLTTRREVEPIWCHKTKRTSLYSAGSVSTFHTFSQRYGRFEARIRNTASTVAGLHEAFWLWPDDREVDVTTWPASGEIDVSETYSRHPNLSIPFLHYTSNDNGGATAGLNTAWHCGVERGVWNTYRLDWTASSLRIFVNDELCLENTSADPAFAEKYIVALTGGLGAAGNELEASTPLPATMEVDHVKVWESDPNPPEPEPAPEPVEAGDGGQAFRDVPEANLFFPHISWLASSGITSGYGDGTFKPTRAITRGQLAVFLYKLAGEPAFTPPRVSPFSDVSTGNDFFPHIAWLHQQGIIKGYADGRFGPTDRVTRGQFAVMLANTDDSSAFVPPARSPFSDLSTDNQFYPHVTWMVGTGVAQGYRDGTFRSGGLLTRGQIAVMLYNYDGPGAA